MIAEFEPILTDEEEIELRASLCRDDFFFFLQEFWEIIIPEEPVWNWHIPYLCTEIQTNISRLFQLKDEEGNIIKKRQPKLMDMVCNIPPGTSKSTIFTIMAPVWAWVNDPTLRILTFSYSASLALDHAVKSRDIIQSDKFKKYFPDLEIKHDQNNKGHYKNTQGGERYATSVGGTITGFHAHLLIGDDPINPKGAASEAERDSANSFMDTTLSTRKVNKSVSLIMLVMQRLNEKDPTGNWLNKPGKEIFHICLPGELSNDVKPVELKENYVDGLLDPIRLNAHDLAGLKIDMGSYGYAGQIQQRPAPEDGGIWKKWFIPVPDKDFPDVEDLSHYGTDWDLAYTENEKNSASAFVSAGKLEEKMYVNAMGFKWVEFPDLIKFMNATESPHYIEAKASGKSAKQTLSKNGIPAVEVKVVGGDKIARATLATPYAEAGLVYIRESLLNKLYNDDKQGILVFPNGAHDDLQDALVQAIQRLLGKKQREWF
jgi:predicted phage terminase large subunit-like protein